MKLLPGMQICPGNRRDSETIATAPHGKLPINLHQWLAADRDFRNVQIIRNLSCNFCNDSKMRPKRNTV